MTSMHTNCSAVCWQEPSRPGPASQVLGTGNHTCLGRHRICMQAGNASAVTVANPYCGYGALASALIVGISPNSTLAAQRAQAGCGSCLAVQCDVAANAPVRLR